MAAAGEELQLLSGEITGQVIVVIALNHGRSLEGSGHFLDTVVLGIAFLYLLLELGHGLERLRGRDGAARVAVRGVVRAFLREALLRLRQYVTLLLVNIVSSHLLFSRSSGAEWTAAVADRATAVLLLFSVIILVALWRTGAEARAAQREAAPGAEARGHGQ